MAHRTPAAWLLSTALAASSAPAGAFIINNTAKPKQQNAQQETPLTGESVDQVIENIQCTFGSSCMPSANTISRGGSEAVTRSNDDGGEDGSRWATATTNGRSDLSDLPRLDPSHDIAAILGGSGNPLAQSLARLFGGQTSLPGQGPTTLSAPGRTASFFKLSANGGGFQSLQRALPNMDGAVTAGLTTLQGVSPNEAGASAPERKGGGAKPNSP